MVAVAVPVMVGLVIARCVATGLVRVIAWDAARRAPAVALMVAVPARVSP